MRGPRKRVAPGQRVDQARLADIGAAGKGHFHARHWRQRFDRRRSPEELPVAGEKFSPLFDQLRIGFGGHAKASLEARGASAVIASEAKQSILPRKERSWIASSLR